MKIYKQKIKRNYKYNYQQETTRRRKVITVTMYENSHKSSQLYNKTYETLFVGQCTFMHIHSGSGKAAPGAYMVRGVAMGGLALFW